MHNRPSYSSHSSRNSACLDTWSLRFGCTRCCLGWLRAASCVPVASPCLTLPIHLDLPRGGGEGSDGDHPQPLIGAELLRMGGGWWATPGLVRPGGCLCLAGPAPCCRTKAGGFGEPSASKAIGLPKTARSSQISTPTSSAGGCHVWDGVGWKCQCQRCQTAQGETQTGQREPGSLLQAQPGPLGSGGIFPYSRGRTTRNKGIWGIPPKTSR